VPDVRLACRFRGCRIVQRTARARSGAEAARKHFLNAVAEIVEDQQTPAERLLALYETDWNGDIDRIFKDCAY
jgi:glutamate--cysteine ligase